VYMYSRVSYYLFFICIVNKNYNVVKINNEIALKNKSLLNRNYTWTIHYNIYMYKLSYVYM